MPIYIYKCPVCRKEKEVIHGIKEKPKICCKNRDCCYFNNPIDRIIQPVNFKIKGYFTSKTGYAKNKEYMKAVEKKEKTERGKG